MAWMLTAACLVMIMAPGVGFLYSGLLRRKNALSMIFLSLAIYSVRLVAVRFFFRLRALLIPRAAALHD